MAAIGTSQREVDEPIALLTGCREHDPTIGLESESVRVGQLDSELADEPPSPNDGSSAPAAVKRTIHNDWASRRHGLSAVGNVVCSGRLK
jgi:hypothetical protein